MDKLEELRNIGTYSRVLTDTIMELENQTCDNRINFTIVQSFILYNVTVILPGVPSAIPNLPIDKNMYNVSRREVVCIYDFNDWLKVDPEMARIFDTIHGLDWNFDAATMHPTEQVSYTVITVEMFIQMLLKRIMPMYYFPLITLYINKRTVAEKLIYIIGFTRMNHEAKDGDVKVFLETTIDGVCSQLELIDKMLCIATHVMSTGLFGTANDMDTSILLVENDPVASPTSISLSKDKSYSTDKYIKLSVNRNDTVSNISFDQLSLKYCRFVVKMMLRIWKAK